VCGTPRKSADAEAIAQYVQGWRSHGAWQAQADCYTLRAFVPAALLLIPYAMNRFLEYVTHHPLLVAATAVLAIVAIVLEIRQRSVGLFAVAPTDAVRMVNAGALVLDLREAPAYESGHISAARNVVGSQLAGQLDSFKKFREKPVLVYCDNGRSSATAASLLRAQGFSKTFVLRGGLPSWRQENLPLIKSKSKNSETKETKEAKQA
jgi:rhodanese-related sulfurtransferase